MNISTLEKSLLEISILPGMSNEMNAPFSDIFFLTRNVTKQNCRSRIE